MPNHARLIYGSTYPEGESPNMDLRWIIEMKLPDPHYLVETGESFSDRVLLASSLEYNRAVAEARNCAVEHYEPYDVKAREAGLPTIVVYLRSKGVISVEVHPETPSEIYALFVAHGFKVTVGGRPWYPARYVRTADEVEQILEVQKRTEEVLWLAVERLEKAKIADGLVYENGEPLTSETLRDFVEGELYRRGCVAPMDTIVSSGVHAGYPHHLGSGPIRAHAPIVFDIFPRSRANGRYADMTRTLFKGDPGDEIKQMYGDVFDAEELGIAMVRGGADGREIHEAVHEFLQSRGHEQGLIHGTGHGINLRVHEPPSIGKMSVSASERAWRLLPGTIVTVEPGLYYPERGLGIRIEDMVVVEEKGCRNLTNFPKDLSEVIIS